VKAELSSGTAVVGWRLGAQCTEMEEKMTGGRKAAAPLSSAPALGEASSDSVQVEQL
jgi:hypothetical protein